MKKNDAMTTRKQIEAGRITLDESDVDLRGMLDELQSVFTMRAQQRDVRLLFELAADVPHYIRTDAVKLRQILINLLNG